MENKVAPRICVLTFSYPRRPGDDAGIFIERLVDAYSKAGASGIVIVPHDHDEPSTERRGSFAVHRIPYGLLSRGKLAFGAGIMPNIRKNPTLIFRIPSLLLSLLWALWHLRAEYDVIHANWIPSQMIAHALNFFTQKPYIVTIRGEDLRLAESGLLRFFFLPSIRAARAVACVSETFSRRIQELFNVPSEVIHHVPNGIDFRSVSYEAAHARLAELGHQPPKQLLLFAGTVIPRKGIETIIEALKHPALSAYSFWCCGRTDDPGYYSQLDAMIQKYSLPSRVKFLGPITPADMPAFFKVATYYVTASTFEGRPNSVLEALATGVRVVASDIPAHREVLKNGALGALFSDATGLAEAIASLDSAPLSKDGTALINSNTWEQTAQKYLALMK